VRASPGVMSMPPTNNEIWKESPVDYVIPHALFSSVSQANLLDNRPVLEVSRHMDNTLVCLPVDPFTVHVRCLTSDVRLEGPFHDSRPVQIRLSLAIRSSDVAGSTILPPAVSMACALVVRASRSPAIKREPRSGKLREGSNAFHPT